VLQPESHTFDQYMKYYIVLKPFTVCVVEDFHYTAADTPTLVKHVVIKVKVNDHLMMITSSL